MASSNPPPNELEEEPKWIRKKGPIALRSKIWSHVKERRDNPNLVRCDHCPRVMKYSSSTSGIAYHLKTHNLKDFAPTTKDSTAEELTANEHTEKESTPKESSAAKESSIKKSFAIVPKMTLDEVCSILDNQ